MAPAEAMGIELMAARRDLKPLSAAEERGQTGHRYVLVGHWVSFRDLARTVTEVTGKPTIGLVAPAWLAHVGAPFVTGYARVLGKRPLFTSESIQIVQHHRNIDCTKAKTELGFAPHAFSDTIADAYEWFERAGQL